MKKLISAALALVLLVSAFACCLTVSAADADPFYAATESIIIEKPASGHFYTNNLSNFSKSIDGDSTTSYKIPVGLNTTAINLNGSATGSDAIYHAILPYRTDSSATGFSFMICVPAADHEYGANVMNSISIFAMPGATDYWNEAEGNKTPAAIPTETEFQPLAKVENLSEKWKVSANGDFRYYEGNFAEPFCCEYILIAFTADCKEHLASGNAMYFNEFSVFTNPIPGAETAEKPTWTKPVIPETTPAPETTKKPALTKSPTVTTKKPVETKDLLTTVDTPETGAPGTEPQEKKGCGSVAAFGVAAIVTVLGTALIRKKED